MGVRLARHRTEEWQFGMNRWYTEDRPPMQLYAGVEVDAMVGQQWLADEMHKLMLRAEKRATEVRNGGTADRPRWRRGIKTS